jgi:hypothetical protein
VEKITRRGAVLSLHRPRPLHHLPDSGGAVHQAMNIQVKNKKNPALPALTTDYQIVMVHLVPNILH